jgi:hypothetical protein
MAGSILHICSDHASLTQPTESYFQIQQAELPNRRNVLRNSAASDVCLCFQVKCCGRILYKAFAMALFRSLFDFEGGLICRRAYGSHYFKLWAIGWYSLATCGSASVPIESVIWQDGDFRPGGWLHHLTSHLKIPALRLSARIEDTIVLENFYTIQAASSDAYDCPKLLCFFD